MADHPKRKRASRFSNGTESSAPKIFPHDPLQYASHADKANWNGFCEIESEPVSCYHQIIAFKDVIAHNQLAFFNVMLRDFGVRGIKVQEIFSLDDDMLACLP